MKILIGLYVIIAIATHGFAYVIFQKECGEHYCTPRADATFAALGWPFWWSDEIWKYNITISKVQNT